MYHLSTVVGTTIQSYSSKPTLWPLVTFAGYGPCPVGHSLLKYFSWWENEFTPAHNLIFTGSYYYITTKFELLVYKNISVVYKTHSVVGNKGLEVEFTHTHSPVLIDKLSGESSCQ